MDMEFTNYIIYQVHVRNYSKAGTFKALENDLDRIKKLGVDILYLMPIHEIGLIDRKGTYGSPYSIKDYYSISPEQGNLDDLKSLIHKVHQLDMKIILDMVFNHTSKDSLILDKHPEYYYYKNGKLGNRVGDWSDIIDLDTTKIETQDYLVEVLKYWVKQGIDGFRFDVASMVNINVFKKAREVLPIHTIFLAESIDTDFYHYLVSINDPVNSDKELSQYFDILYNYNYFRLLEKYLDNKIAIDELIDLINKDDINRANCVENHDVKRVASLRKDDELLSLIEFSFYLRGNAFIYMGEEYKLSHRPDFFEKDVVQLNNNEKMYRFFQRLALEKKKRGQIIKQNIKKISDHSMEVTLENNQKQIFKKIFKF